MSARLSKPRQEPRDPDETFSALVTRLIITNRAERASRERISPTLSALPDVPSDRAGEADSRSVAEG
jgi:hypothetical protein